MTLLGRLRGQSTVELALLAPALVGIFTLALQGGLIVSDQVNLEHYATEAAQWAVLHPDVATADSGTPGTITQHIYQQMCNGASSPPSASGARFCNGPLASSASVVVSERTTPTSQSSLGPMRLLAATRCVTQKWTLAASPTTAVADMNGTGSAHFVVTLSTSGTGTTPQVSLGYRSKPATFLTPYYSPPDVNPSNNTSTLDITAQPSSTNGAHKVTLKGTDQCNHPYYFTVTVVVANSSATTPAVCPDAAPTVAGVDLTVISNATATIITITGSNFTNGAAVTINNTAATLVTVVSSTKIVATIPAGLPTGVYNVNVTNPDNCVATANSGVTIVTNSNGGNFGGICTGSGCSGSSYTNGGTTFGGGTAGGGTAGAVSASASPPVISQNACAPTAANYQMLITITWSEPLIIPWITTGATLTATQYVFCQ